LLIAAYLAAWLLGLRSENHAAQASKYQRCDSKNSHQAYPIKA
jgi:hypothetical protein